MKGILMGFYKTLTSEHRTEAQLRETDKMLAFMRDRAVAPSKEV